MKIVVFGAGAIGSFFGGMLSKNNRVCLIGRKPHINAIKKNNLKINGKTEYSTKIEAVESIEYIDFKPDIVIFSVKSYDTLGGVKQVSSLIDSDTLFISIQNGLDNIKKISNYVKQDNIAVCVTTNGVIFQKPGVITHTGFGTTLLGMIDNKKDPRVFNFLKILNQSGIKSELSNDIRKDIWIKGIINSSINPLTAFFNCKNGYILKNPVLSNILSKVCLESCNVAVSNGIDVEFDDVLEKTKNVIGCTEENYSSMLQSVKKNKKTEINSINGVIVKMGLNKNQDVFLNRVLVYSIKNSF